MSDSYDVIVVGGGIAGCALAARLARDGVRVLVLEKTTEYVDRVRGEAMMPWGVAELKQLGLYETLVDAGGIHTQNWVLFAEGLPVEDTEAARLPIGQLLPGAPPLNIGHPVACAALARAACNGGAEMIRGVTSVHLCANPRGVAFAVDGDARAATARIVVGADGRRSTIRDQAGIELERQDPPHMLTGLLIEPAGPLPDYDVVAAERDMGMLYFLQPGGRVRIYAAPGLDDRDRFTGRDGASRLLEAVRLDCLPMANALADGRVAGPCATYPADDTWTAEPYADGVVLIGDAAGYNNPNIGQGLSLALRDVRIVSDVLVAEHDWPPATFAPYASERLERMRRVRFNADLLAATWFGFTADPEERLAAFARRMSDPVLFQGALATFTGPETAPSKAFTAEAFDTVVGA